MPGSGVGKAGRQADPGPAEKVNGGRWLTLGLTLGLTPGLTWASGLASPAVAGRYFKRRGVGRRRMSGHPGMGHHDMGGQAAGPVDRGEHDHAFWEKRVDALMRLLSAPERQLLRVDELRRNIEALPPDAYDTMS